MLSSTYRDFDMPYEILQWSRIIVGQLKCLLYLIMMDPRKQICCELKFSHNYLDDPDGGFDLLIISDDDDKRDGASSVL